MAPPRSRTRSFMLARPLCPVVRSSSYSVPDTGPASNPPPSSSMVKWTAFPSFFSAALTLRALQKNRILNEVVVARDGQEAVDYLLGGGAFAGGRVGVVGGDGVRVGVEADHHLSFKTFRILFFRAARLRPVNRISACFCH